MPSFSLSCFIGADSLVAAGPVNVKQLTSEPTAEETRVDLNASLSTLADQLAQAHGAATNNKPPEHATESDNIMPQLPNDHAKSLNLHRPDKEMMHNPLPL
jgi:hypothetical protein